MAVSARRLARDVLDRVLGRDQPFDPTFHNHPGLPALAVRDRAFARLMATTVLRRKGQIDDLLARFVARPPRSIRVSNTLRLGLAQLLFLETPPHAALSETVALLDGRDGYARGLVNAVLRRALREAPAIVAAQDPVRLNLPRWLYESWTRAHGEAVTRAIALVHEREPPLDLSARDNPGALADLVDGVHLAGPTVRRASAGPIEALPGYGEGAFWVQDAAAALPARLLGDIRGRPVVDLCAAPGGKTAQLAAAGAEVTAVELAPQRVDTLRRNLARLRLAAEVVVADALEWRPAAPAPFVLLDAPCTATGTIRRHPDIAWHKNEADVTKMAVLQLRLLEAACAVLEPGGTLVYASCSLQPDEGERLAAEALHRLPLDASPVAAAEVGLPVDVTPEGWVRTLPSHMAAQGGMDGFFIARFRRRRVDRTHPQRS